MHGCVTKELMKLSHLSSGNLMGLVCFCPECKCEPKALHITAYVDCHKFTKGFGEFVMAPAACQRHSGMRFTVFVIRTYLYLMQKSGIGFGINDTQSDVLESCGMIPCNSNSSSSAKKPHHMVWFSCYQ